MIPTMTLILHRNFYLLCVVQNHSNVVSIVAYCFNITRQIEQDIKPTSPDRTENSLIQKVWWTLSQSLYIIKSAQSVGPLTHITFVYIFQLNFHHVNVNAKQIRTKCNGTTRTNTPSDRFF